MKYTNRTGISLPLALWLTADDYDRKPMKDFYGVTEILKSIRQIVLGRRLEVDLDQVIDVKDVIAARIGQTIHAAVEDALINKQLKTKLALLGYPQRAIEKIRVNSDDPDEDHINIHTETRCFKQIGDKTLSGKYDFVIEGDLHDLKTTKVFMYTKNDFKEKAILQGSMYRYLDPNIITGDFIHVNFLFKDWMASQTFRTGYPKGEIVTAKLPLKSLSETEHWVKTRLDLIASYEARPEEHLPECTPEELWKDAPVWKYYKDPEKRTKSTKNFDNLSDANLRLAKEGKGIVLEVRGNAKACKTCNVFALCTQKDRLIDSGELVIG